MGKHFRPDVFIIPSKLSEKANIEPLDEKVYAIIYWFENMSKGICVASNKTIAEVANPRNPQERSIQNSLKRLEEHGFIKRIYKDKAKRHRSQIKSLVKYTVQSENNSFQNEMGMTLERNGDDHISNIISKRTNNRSSKDSRLSLKRNLTDKDKNKDIVRNTTEVSNTTNYVSEEINVVPCDEDGNEVAARKKEKDRPKYEYVLQNIEKLHRNGKKFMARPTQYKAIKSMKANGYGPRDMVKAYGEMLEMDFWQDKYPDMHNVLKYLNQKR